MILRLRGRSDLGTTFMDVLLRFALALDEVGSKLVLVSVDERVREQLDLAGITAEVVPANVFLGDERVGATLARAEADAARWVAERAAAARADA